MGRKKHQVMVGGDVQFNFGEVNPRLYDPAKGWFHPDPEQRSGLESAALGRLARGSEKPVLMEREPS